MVRSPCCEDRNLKKGPWTPEEDEKLVEYIKKHGCGSWRALPKLAGLNRCGKSCRLRWTNYLRPDLKRGKFSDDEEETIIKLHSVLGNKWSRIAAHLPGRTDNEIKNFWNTHVKKKFLKMGLDLNTHLPRGDHFSSLMNLSRLLSMVNFSNSTDVLHLYTDAAPLTKTQFFQHPLQIINSANGLLGSNNLTPLMEGSSLNSEVLGFPNTGIRIQESQNDYQAISNNSWAFRSEVVNFNNNCSSSSYDIPIEQTLPSLVSFSPENSSADQMERKRNRPACVADTSSSSDIFEAWGELMDDETCGSYWKDILEYNG